MGSFDARLHLIGHTRVPLPVVVDLTEERLIVTAGAGHLADWLREDIDITTRNDGFHIRAEGEEVVLNVTEADRFAIELGRSTPPGRSRPSARGRARTGDPRTRRATRYRPGACRTAR